MTNAAYSFSRWETKRVSGVISPSTCCCVSIPGGPSFSVAVSIAGPPGMRSGAHASSMPRVMASVEFGLMTRIVAAMEAMLAHGDALVLQAGDQAHQRPERDQIDERRSHHRRRVVRQGLDVARVIQKLGEADDARERSELDDFQRIADEVRQHVARRLRQDHPYHRPPGENPVGARRPPLPRRYALESGAEDLAVVARRVQQE